MIRRPWTNRAHHDIALWKLCALGAAMGVAGAGLGELLLRLAS